MIDNPDRLKAYIKNLAINVNIEPKLLIRQFMLERFLERISKSKYADKFILKGGMLVSSFVGIEERSTMDIDTTVKGITLTIDEMKKIIAEISSITLDDNVQFRIKKVSDIMQELEYPGVRFSMDATLSKTIIPIKIDISTGDIITPREVQYQYKLMFENRCIPLMTYPLETVLAEKLESIFAKSIGNTRMRDFYDIHILLKTQQVDYLVLRKALERTANKRGNVKELDNIRTVLNQVESSENFKEQWNMYCSKFKYAQKYPWHDVVKSVMILSSKIGLLDKFTLKITDERPSILAKISKHKEDISKEDKLTPDKTIHKTNDLEL